MENTNIIGVWRFQQEWDGQRPYAFNAVISENGSIVIEGSGTNFYGTYKILGNSSSLSLAIADFDRRSVTSYVGNIVGNAMGGQMRGSSNGRSFTGVWSAHKLNIELDKMPESLVPEN